MFNENVSSDKIRKILKITSAKFICGLTGPERILEDGTPQVAFIGRSNVGKSSVINSLASQKHLARASSFPGRTQELNIFLINTSVYLVDLPGYGFAKASRAQRERIQELINWYLFNSAYEQKLVVLIIDAAVGLTDLDIETLHALETKKKNIVIVANKVDKIKKSLYKKQLQSVQDAVGHHQIIPYSAEMKIGIEKLTDEILK